MNNTHHNNNDQSIDYFAIEISEPLLDDLRQRLKLTRFPDEETVGNWDQGIPLSYVRELVDYWRNDYDWHQCEQLLNSWPNFKTQLDGIDIHFIHQRSQHTQATPILLTHGWPGSVLEFRHLISRLTDPVAHGGTPDDAFHVVIPALPGYGFSGKPRAPGVGVEKIASMWAKLMQRLNYSHYVAHGGDWGGLVTQAMAVQQPQGLLAIHTTLPVVAPPASPANTPREHEALSRFADYQANDSGYALQQSTRPQTLGYGLADSPVGQLAWIVEKYGQWTDCEQRGIRHPENAVTRQELIDTVMLYWLTNSAASAARLYWESFRAPDFSPISLPSGISEFAVEIMRPPQHWCEQRFSKLVYFNDNITEGGHFAALEVPDALTNELRAWKRALSSHGIIE